MSAKANITLTDAASTPVNHVYYPTQALTPGVLAWVDRTASSIALAQNRLTLGQRAASKQAKSNKLSWKLECPIIEQTAAYGPYSLAYTNIGSIEIVFHERATQQERKDMLAQLRDLLSEAINTTLCHDLDFIY